MTTYFTNVYTTIQAMPVGDDSVITATAVLEVGATVGFNSSVYVQGFCDSFDATPYGVDGHDSNIIIADSGLVRNITLTGDGNTIVNAGVISDDYFPIQFTLNGTFNGNKNVLTNTGLIEAYAHDAGAISP